MSERKFFFWRNLDTLHPLFPSNLWFTDKRSNDTGSNDKGSNDKGSNDKGSNDKGQNDKNIFLFES